MRANAKKTHGYWVVPNANPEDPKGPSTLKNATTALAQDARNYADHFTGLSGDFDKDFAPQLPQPTPTIPTRK